MAALPRDTGWRVAVREHVDSTHDELRRLLVQGAPAGTVVVAEEQSAGRGRMGRRWHAPRGPGLYLSALLDPGPARHATRWTLGAAVAACAVCRETAGCPADIEWPNDLVVGRAKLGGILAELTGGAAAPGGARRLLLGLGLNVSHGADEFPAELRPRVTSLLLAGATGILERERLAAEFLLALQAIADLLRRDAWDTVAEQWEAFAPGARGAPVRVEADGADATPLVGWTDGLDLDGALRVRLDDGTRRSVRMAGSVTWLER